MYFLKSFIVKSKVCYSNGFMDLKSHLSAKYITSYHQCQVKKQFYQGLCCCNVKKNPLVYSARHHHYLPSISRDDTIPYSNRSSHLDNRGRRSFYTKSHSHDKTIPPSRGTKITSDYGDDKRFSEYSPTYVLIVLGAVTVGCLIAHKWKIVYLATATERSTNTNQSSTTLHLPKYHTEERKDLPIYKRNEIEQHNTLEKRVWVTYGIGVYDITDFIPNHPGGDKIMLGAGSAIDPFWAIYQQHNTKEILTLIEQFRIGNLSKEERGETEDMDSIWANEPKRHPLLKPASQKPFNAEPPIQILADNFYTPNEFFYVRNHLPVPVIDEKDYELEIEIETKKSGAKPTVKCLKMSDIKKLPKHSVTAAVMCGGNRRSEMTKVKSVKGLSWGAGAVGNAKWSGARLRDILLRLGVKPNEQLHVIFEGADLDPTSHPYGASIPLSKALDDRGDVILAYEMNDQPLNRDHGFPLRVIVPGTVGARNVKWLTRISVSENESPSHWQQNDYKGFSPSTDWDTVDFSKSPAIQAMPVTSAICSPTEDSRIHITDDSHIEVKGYAWSGGGRRIVRVDLTIDQGRTWYVAKLEQGDEPDGRHYGWSLWSARIPIDRKKSGTEIEIWSKAVDSAYNVQPESFENIWNLRGVLSNAYHRVRVTVV